MKKQISTLFYSLQGFGNTEAELFNLDELTDSKSSEFSEVYDFLDKNIVEPSSRIVDNILEFCKDSTFS